MIKDPADVLLASPLLEPNLTTGVPELGWGPGPLARIRCGTVCDSVLDYCRGLLTTTEFLTID